MRNESSERSEPTAGGNRLPARVFYGVIVAGVLLGIALSSTAAWAYLEAGDREPTGRRIWGDVAKEFVIPIAVMMGSTFGGIAGFAVAVVCDWRSGRLRHSE